MRHALIDHKNEILTAGEVDEFVDQVVAKLTPQIAGLLDGVKPLVASESGEFQDAVVRKLVEPIIGWRAAIHRAELEAKVRQAFAEVEAEFRARSVRF